MGESEKVYVEFNWWDGPVEGIADVNGVPHRFVGDIDEDEGYRYSYKLFLISESDLELEIEQWKIFMHWYRRFDDGEVDTTSHPANGGINPRWDELDSLLRQSREVPEVCLLAHATFEFIEGRESRYEESGPNYRVTWHFIG
ncbi:hypothetical protein [Hahella sp. HN01]|uniref:hypothetical protein n=1 Tax=Hahella sp. HN01 TaxID=2847262 RepID=UPI001C1E98F1|nr:hypothetical protein [Hahella sp. HN01]MBU6951179.1 hypothetical protein [Hahella sp. HN01]